MIDIAPKSFGSSISHSTVGVEPWIGFTPPKCKQHGDFLLNEQYANPEEVYLIESLGKVQEDARKGPLTAMMKSMQNNADLPTRLQ